MPFRLFIFYFEFRCSVFDFLVSGFRYSVFDLRFRCPAFGIIMCCLGPSLSVFVFRYHVLSTVSLCFVGDFVIFGMRLRYFFLFGNSATAGCRKGNGPLPHARRVDHRSPVVSSPALQVSRLPSRDQGGQAPAHHPLAGLAGDTSGFGEKGVFFSNGGAGMERVVTAFFL